MSHRQRTILITGSTDGVGRCVAERIAGPGDTILIHGRDRVRGQEVVAAVAAAGAQARYYRADFSSLAEVRDFAVSVAGDHPTLDVLINNAGIGTQGDKAGRHESADGYELRFAVNYLAGFLLTRLLLPALQASASARIVNVASIGQQAIDFQDVMLEHDYSGPRAYCQSKLAQIMSTFDLAEELEGTRVTANALHPATYMDTSMVRADGITPISTVVDGANAILHLAADPRTAKVSGAFYDGLRPARANAQAYDTNARRRLRALSFDLVGLVDPTA